MKKAAVFLMILTLSVSSAACGNKEKDDNQADAKTEQSQNADNSKDNDKSDTQTKEADNKMYELSSEDDVWTIKVLRQTFLRTRQEHLNVLEMQMAAVCNM